MVPDHCGRTPAAIVAASSDAAPPSGGAQRRGAFRPSSVAQKRWQRAAFMGAAAAPLAAALAHQPSRGESGVSMCYAVYCD
jgi:hypothetical protein|eukprot:COSAG01_NODE_6821_length_3483_cov_11.864657_4_plen_81_part_00